MVKVTGKVAETVRKTIRPMYDETIQIIATKMKMPERQVVKRVGDFDEIYAIVASAIEITTESMRKSEIWIDEFGRIKRLPVIDTITKRFVEYEEREQARIALEVEGNCKL